MLDKDIKQLLSNSKNVALIGISLDSKKPSNFVMKYLQRNTSLRLFSLRYTKRALL